MNGVRTADHGLAMVTLAGVGFGLNPLFARVLYAEGLSPEVAVFVRFALTAALLAPVAPGLLRQPRLAALGLAMGAGMATGTLAYFHALAVLPVSLAVLVYYTYPLFTVLIGWLVLRRPLTHEAVTAAGLVAAACALVVSPRGLSTAQIEALLLCFLAPLTYAVTIHALSTWLTPLPLWRRMCAGIWGHMLVLIPAVALIDQGPLLPQAPEGWAAVAGLATIASLLPQVAFLLGAPLAGADRTAIGGSAELLASLAIGWAVLGETVEPRAVVAAALLLAALFVVRRAR